MGEYAAREFIRTHRKLLRIVHGKYWHAVLLSAFVFFAASSVALGADDPSLLGRLEKMEGDYVTKRQLGTVQGQVKTLQGQVKALQEQVEGLLRRKPKLACKEVTSSGLTATCPAGYLATGCSAGHNFGSHSIESDGRTCKTDQNADKQWTTAHCCAVSFTD